MIKLSNVPAYASPGAPAVISPVGRKRRLHNFPAAPELSTGVLERVHIDPSSDAGRRKLLVQQQQAVQQKQQTGSQAAYSNPSTPLDHTARHENLGTRRLQQQEQQWFAEAEADTATQKPSGWSGLWWAEAGGVGLAAGPAHIIHAISTVLAVYTVDPDTGSKQASKIFALQDLFAPVGASNCK